MHKKFAQRLAKVARAKRRTAGPMEVSLWWSEAFGSLAQEHFLQVMDELRKLPR